MMWTLVETGKHRGLSDLSTNIIRSSLVAVKGELTRFNVSA